MPTKPTWGMEMDQAHPMVHTEPEHPLRMDLENFKIPQAPTGKHPPDRMPPGKPHPNQVGQVIQAVLVAQGIKTFTWIWLLPQSKQA